MKVKVKIGDKKAKYDLPNRNEKCELLLQMINDCTQMSNSTPIIYNSSPLVREQTEFKYNISPLLMTTESTSYAIIQDHQLNVIVEFGFKARPTRLDHQSRYRNGYVDREDEFRFEPGFSILGNWGWLGPMWTGRPFLYFVIVCLLDNQVMGLH